MNTPAREILKCLCIIGLIFTSFQLSAQNSVGIGTNTPNTNSVLELVSTGNNQGFLMPRMTTVQRTDATFTSGLTTTENGLMVFDTDEGAVYFWFNGSWVNTTTLLAGTGIQITGNTIENIGDTDATDDITTATVATGDVTGDFANLNVAGIQGQPVSNTVPTLDYVLKWDGSQWLPQPDAGNVYTAGTGIDVTGTVITNTGDTDASDDLTTASTAGGDVSGGFSTLQVTGIQGNTVDAGTPATGNILKWDGTQWLLSADNDAQDAASVPFDDAVAVLGATDVQAAIEALDAAIDGLSTGDMTQATYDTDANGIVDFAEDANTINGGLTVDTAVPVGADFTDDQTAANVPVTPSGNLTSTDVQAALVELQTDIDGAAGDMTQATYDVGADGVVDNSELVNGLTVETAVPVSANFTDDQTATEVGVTATGNLTSTDVQSALVELQTDIDGATGDMNQATYDVGADGVVDNSELVNGLSVETAVPVGAVFTDNELPPTAATGEILEWNGAAWVAAVLSVDPINIGPGSAVSGDVLSYNGATWNPTSPVVDPVNILPGSAISGDVLSYDGLNWVPAVSSVDPANILPGSAISGDVLSYDGLNWVPTVSSVDPANILPGSAISGDVLSYDGLNWVPTVSSVDPANILPGSAVTGDVLSYDGLNWVPQASNAHITANEIPRGDGAGQVSSNLFSDGTNIGVGQATPVSNIHIGLDNHIFSEGNDLVITDNIHWNAGNPTYTEDGSGVAIGVSSTGGDIGFFHSPSGLSGNIAPLNPMATLNSTGFLSNGTIQASEGLTVAGNGSVATNLELGDADNSAFVRFKVPDVMVNPSVTFTLPDGEGAPNSVLSTDGAGTLSWVNNTTFDTNFSIPKGDGVGGMISSDIYSSAANEITVGSATPMTNVKFAVINEASPLFTGLANHSDNAGDVVSFGLLRSRGSQAAPTTLQSADDLGRIGFNVWDGSSQYVTAAAIQTFATSNHAFSSNYGTQLSILTVADGTFTEAERLRIQGDGTMILYDNTSIGDGPTSAVKLQITPDAGQNNAFRINPEAGGTNTGEFQMMELSVNGTNFVGLKAADNIANTRVYTWPDADGTPGQFLTTDGAGIMSWTSAGSFNTTNEIPRGDGAGLVSSNIFSDGANISMGSNQLSLPINLSVIQEGSGNAVAGVATFSSSTPDDASSLALIKARGTEASPVNNLSGDRIGTISFTSRVNGAFGDAASIEVFAAEPHATSQGADFTIRTAANGETSVVDRIQIDGNGDVNIVNGNLGVNVAPLYAVDVNGDINFSGQLRTQGNAILDVNTTTFTTSLGDLAGTGGQFNAFVGYQAGDANTANQNAFFGYQAGQSNTSGASNTYLGGQAGNQTTTGASNTAIGFNSLRDNIIGNNNTTIGMQAGLSSTGDNNVYIGQDAGRFSTANSNVFLGAGTGGSDIAGSEIILIGQGANVGGSTLSNAIAIGTGVVVGNDNTAVIGGSADMRLGVNIDPSDDFHVHNATTNTSLKFTNAFTGTLGTDGFQLSVNGTATSLLNRENTRMDFGNNGTIDFTIGPAGNVGISELTPGFTLDIAHDNAVASGGLSLKNLGGGENVSLFVNNTTSDLEFHANNGAVILGRILNSTGAYEQLSDRRAKKNFESVGSVLADINKVNITKYHYNKQDDSEIKQIGVVAQELKEIFPSLVSYDDQKDIYTVNYAGLAPVTVKAIQELNALILAQKDEIEILRSQIASKDIQLNKLENDVSAIKEALGLDNKTSEK